MDTEPDRIRGAGGARAWLFEAYPVFGVPGTELLLAKTLVRLEFTFVRLDDTLHGMMKMPSDPAHPKPSLQKRVGEQLPRFLKPRTRIRIHYPGEWALTSLKVVFSRKTVEKYFEPVVGDMRDEEIEAIADGAGRLTILFIRIRGYWSLNAAVLLILPFTSTLYKMITKQKPPIIAKDTAISEGTAISKGTAPSKDTAKDKVSGLEAAKAQDETSHE